MNQRLQGDEEALLDGLALAGRSASRSDGFMRLQMLLA
jgi:hypothetical protein